ncbi:MAG: EAL domain-containing protein [Thiohalophilus sp.]|uniref:EAL domain-containing protein n=1 Tax=Thiohalophilus sp. TaxID=3028392 RepID=UPI00286FFCB4|nr:EAL domain-containing protein [Thiohalophilus sp.]MDR9435628.1 EAL domain-containing protein [Thiohalophilus sp.]
MTHTKQPRSCGQCANGESLGFKFSFAFQPIVDLTQRRIVSYEALVRGPEGEPASWVLDQLNDSNRYRFDQTCRVKAVKLASELDLKVNLNINFFPNAVYQPEVCIRTTLEAAKTYNFPTDQIVFEITEGEKVEDHQHLIDIVNEYHRLGFSMAIDDFGAGYSGLNLLTEYQPDIIKLDRQIISDIHQQPPKQAIVEGIVHTCGKLGIELVAEGVEEVEEIRWLRDTGIRLFQGFWFARPAFQELVIIEPNKFDQI